MIDRVLEETRQLCGEADLVISALTEGSVNTWRAMTHADRRLRHNIDVMTEVMNRLSRDVKDLQQILRPVDAGYIPFPM